MWPRALQPYSQRISILQVLCCVSTLSHLKSSAMNIDSHDIRTKGRNCGRCTSCAPHACTAALMRLYSLSWVPSSEWFVPTCGADRWRVGTKHERQQDGAGLHGRWCSPRGSAWRGECVMLYTPQTVPMRRTNDVLMQQEIFSFSIRCSLAMSLLSNVSLWTPHHAAEGGQQASAGRREGKGPV